MALVSSWSDCLLLEILGPGSSHWEYWSTHLVNCIFPHLCSGMDVWPWCIWLPWPHAQNYLDSTSNILVSSIDILWSGWSKCTWQETSDVTELGLLSFKKHCFNDLSVSPMYVAGHFLHDIWYTGPTTLSFFNLSLGLTSSCLSVLVGLKYMGTSYLLKMYGITTGNFLFLCDTVCGGCKLIWSLSSFPWIMEVLSNGVLVGVEWSPWYMTQSGYPLRCNAFLKWSFSFCNFAGSLTTMVPFYSDQGFCEVESSVSLLYNYPVLQSLNLYFDWYYLDWWIYIILNVSINMNPLPRQAYDRGPLNSDYSNSFRGHSDIRNGRNINLLGWDSVRES